MRSVASRNDWALNVLLLAVAVVGLLTPSSFGTVVGQPAPGHAASAGPGVAWATVLSSSGRAGPIPAVPAHAGDPRGDPPAAAVNPEQYYTAEPAPMGVADFGVGASDQPYTYNTSQFLANFSWQSLNFRGNTSTEFTVQLNVVLVFTDSGSTYVYWVQDVAWVESSSATVTFEDNIWNFSTTSGCLSNSSVQGNGTVWAYHPPSCEGYYAVSATVQPGAERTMPTPGDFSLLLRSYRAAGGVPEVAFEYWDGVTDHPVTYDNVLWPWASAVSSDPGFVVDGTQYAPNSLFYDAEAIVGGPGGGSSTQAEDLTHTELRLFYWNGHNFQAPRSAWNFGSDTGESVGDLQSVWSDTYTAAANGTPLLVQWNGTASGSGLGQVYDQGSVGYLNLSAPGISVGTVAVGSTDWPFVNEEANVTLTPGTYRIWVNSSAGPDDLGWCVISAGDTTNVSTVFGCTPTASAPVASSTDLDVGQSTTLQSRLVSPGSGGDTFAWSVVPTGLNCTAVTNVTLQCQPTSPGVYTVEVTVTDSLGQSTTTATLSVVVHVDPTVALDLSRSVLDVGQGTQVNAVAAGGSGAYRYSWSGVPPGCVAAAVSSFSCVPGTAGAYVLEVTATDSDGWAAMGTENLTVFEDPAILEFESAPGSVLEGRSVQIQVETMGGGSPLTYVYRGLPPGCLSTNSSILTCVPDRTGTFAIEIVVTDPEGYQVNATTSVTVEPQFLGLPAWEGYSVLGAAVAGVSAVGALLGLRRSRRPAKGPRTSG